MIDLDAPLPDWAKVIAITVVTAIYFTGLGYLMAVLHGYGKNNNGKKVRK